MSNVIYGLLILSSKYLAHKSHLGSEDFMSVETERDFDNYLVLSQMFYILGKEARGLKMWKDYDLMLSKESCSVRVKCLKRVNRTHILIVHIFVTFPR